MRLELRAMPFAEAGRRPLFGMRNDVENNRGVALDSKVESPISVHPGLPFIICFAIFLGVQGWVVQVGEKKCRLFVKYRSDSGDHHLLAVRLEARSLRGEVVAVRESIATLLVWLGFESVAACDAGMFNFGALD